MWRPSPDLTPPVRTELPATCAMCPLHLARPHSHKAGRAAHGRIPSPVAAVQSRTAPKHNPPFRAFLCAAPQRITCVQRRRLLRTRRAPSRRE
eukprot:362977-Chlamydomonas_euryale.AAC.5